jgi:oligosaccharide repeat unit polymerase
MSKVGLETMSLLRAPLVPILVLAWLGSLSILPLLGMNVTWIGVTGIAMLFSLVLLRHEAGIFDFKHLSLTAAWYWSHIFFVVIPSLFAFYLETGAHPLRFIISVAGSLILVPLGILIGQGICGSRRGAVKAYYLKPIEGEAADSRSYALLGLIVFCTCLGLYHATEIETIPLLYMIQHPGAAAAVVFLREESGKLLDSPLTYFYEVLSVVMFPILVMLTGIRFFCVRTRWNRIVFFGTFAITVLYCGMTVERSPIGMAVLCLVLAMYMRRKGEPKEEIWLIPIALFGFPLIVFLFTVGSGGAFFARDLLNAIGVRIFYGGARVLFFYFDLVPEGFPYQNGTTIGVLAKLMGEPKSMIANNVGLHIDPTLPQSVTANAPFLGTFYADWGMTGVVLGCIVTGIIVAVIQHYIVAKPKTLRNLCIYGFVMLKLTLLSLAALPYMLASGGVLIAMLPLFVEDLLGVRRGRTRNRQVLSPEDAFRISPHGPEFKTRQDSV